MPFLIIGVLLLGIGTYFLRKHMKSGYKMGVTGMTMVIITGVIVILLYGLFYTLSL